MDPQGTNSQSQAQVQGQQRYCPTPMAPPSPAPTPPIQHHPPPSMSPAPHAHSGYYGHHTHHSYAPPQHNPYYTNYYGHSGTTHHHAQQSTNPTPPPPPQHYQQHQQPQQQWSQHHGYYQQSPQTQQQPQQTQSTGYPAHSPSPNPYAYMQQQHQQPQPTPQQQQQTQQLGAPLGSPQGSQSMTSQGLGQQQSQVQQQQPQMQSQHALMNLSRFVSQQSPCPSPSPHPQSPTTPLPPMGSPHYPSPPQMQSHQGHHNIHGQQASHHHQQQMQQHPLQSTTPTPPIHQPNYSPTSLTSSQQQQLSHPNQNAMMNMSQHVNNSSNGVSMSSHQQINNYANTPPQSVSSSLGGMSSNSPSSGINNTNQGMASVGNGSYLLVNQVKIEQGNSKSHPQGHGSPSASTNSNNMASDPHGSGSTSPSGSCSSSTTRTLCSPSLTSNVSSSASNGQMLPVRLQNMQRGPRTKASMRKFLEEQHSSSSAPETMQEGTMLSDMDAEGNAKSTQSTKKAPKKPRNVRKGAKGAVEEVPKNVEASPKKSTKKRSQGSLPLVSDIVESDNTESGTPTRPGYTKRGIKIGRPLKSKSIDETGKEPPKKKAKKGKKGAVASMDEDLIPEEAVSAPLLSKSEESSADNNVKSIISEIDATYIESEGKKEPLVVQESSENPVSDFPGKEETETNFSTPTAAAKSPAKRTNKRSKSNSKKVRKDDEEWQLNPSTESESEAEEEEEYVAPEVDRTPRRPLRPRVSKEITPKSDEPETTTRSRYSRARRSSSSYKEVSMSSSRSKSPKDVVTSTSATPKKSSRSSSPSKVASTKSSVKTSAKKVPTPKSSPRLKEASPSPVRLRQLKVRSPDDAKRELRSSKERDETPKRSPRARQTQNSKDAQLDAQETPPSSRRSSKSPRDSTPIRVCSPRLAKEKSAVSAKTPTNRRKNSVEPVGVAEATPVLEEETVSPARSVNKKKSPAKPRGKKGIVEATPESITEAASDLSSPPLLPATKKASKKGKTTAGVKKARPVKKGKKQQKEEILNIPTTTEIISLRAEESEHQSELLIDETPTDDIQQLAQTVDPSAGVPKTESIIDLSSINVVNPLKSKSSRRASTNSESSRRSKSPRVSGGKSPEMIASANAALMAQCSSPRVILPNLSVNDLPKKYGEEQLSPDYVKMNTNNLSEQVASVIPAMESPTGKGAQLQQPNNKGEDVSVPETEEQEGVENVENSATDLSVPSDSVKKVRKPRTPKIQKMTQSDESSEDQKHSESSLESPEKLSSKQKAQIQFQQRKANLEVEVAQVLLEMKNSSKSPSPVKGMDALISPQAGPVLMADALNTSPNLSLQGKATKGKSRKNSTVSIGTSESNNHIPVEPLDNKLPTPTLPLKPKRAYNRKKPLLNATDPNASQESKLKSKASSKKKSVGADETKNVKTPKSKKKSGILVTETPVVEMQHEAPPVALSFVNSSEPQSLEGLPSMEISPGASIYSVNTSVSFQNSPMKVHGPVKVSKTVTIPEADTVSSNAEGVTQESGKSKGKSKDKSPLVGDKSKKKKTVVPKALTPTAVPNSGEKPPKRKYNRKKSKDGSAASASIADNQIKVEPKNLAGDNNSQTALCVEASFPEPTSVTLVSKSTEKGNKKGNISDLANADSPVVKKRRKSSTKVQSMEVVPFQLQPRPIPIPTLFAKPSPLAALKNGSGAGASNNDSKDKALVGPSLKVIGGKTTFYRGSDEEEVDSEPPIPKRTNVEYDPNVPWLCCFCNLGPHAQKLGDLFGPYYAEMASGSGKTKCTEKRETWMHQDCALWAGNVVLIGTKLHNLEETLTHSNQDSCTTCGQKGATIGCLKRGCKQAVHFPCAVRKSWKLDQETFQSFCPAHVT